MIPWIDENSALFPNPKQALSDPDGLLCAGANLEPETLLTAYPSGIFPWFSDDDPILWWSPNNRCILYPSEIHISRSLKRRLNKNNYRIKTNTCFESVMRACAETRKNQQGTWITEEMIAAYCELSYLGHAHSIELFIEGHLSGGLYGVAIGRVFFAESMFSKTPNASKIVLVWLCQKLEQYGFDIVDCQVESPHLMTMGARIINRSRYLALIRESCNLEPVTFPWHKNYE